MEIRSWNEIIGKNRIGIELEFFFQNGNNTGHDTVYAHVSSVPPPYLASNTRPCSLSVLYPDIYRTKTLTHI